MVAKHQRRLQREVQAIDEWELIEERVAVGELSVQLQAWSQPRRFVVVRTQLREPRLKQLLEVPAYEYRVMVTNRDESPEWLWRHYDQRAAIEPRISELKSDLGAQGFCLRKFYANEAVFRSVLVLFNLLSWLQSLRPQTVQQRPATLRSELWTCGAIAGRSGHKMVLYLSAGWGGLSSRMPLLERILGPPPATSPK